jgi:hypothetical protein
MPTRGAGPPPSIARSISPTWKTRESRSAACAARLRPPQTAPAENRTIRAPPRDATFSSTCAWRRASVAQWRKVLALRRHKSNASTPILVNPSAPLWWGAIGRRSTLGVPGALENRRIAERTDRWPVGATRVASRRHFPRFAQHPILLVHHLVGAAEAVRLQRTSAKSLGTHCFLRRRFCGS